MFDYARKTKLLTYELSVTHLELREKGIVMRRE